MNDSPPFPEWFFDRDDESSDDVFYAPPRFVHHIDDQAVHTVGFFYDHLGLGGSILDLMSSWVSHFHRQPDELIALGMNHAELAANEMATDIVVRDLNVDPSLPFDDARFDHAVCCVSVDYLIHPVEVFREVRRTLKPGGSFVCTFSNRCFPDKVIAGWRAATDGQRCAIVAAYFNHSGGWAEPRVAQLVPDDLPGDALFAVWATRLDD